MGISYRKLSKKTTNYLHRGEGFHLYDSMRENIRSHFDIEKELKTSDRGAVYLVWNRATKTRSIYREFTGSGEVYRKMQGMEYPYLPKIEAVEEKDGRVFVVEEYIQGDTLAYILKNGALLPLQAQEIAMQLCRALESLHSLGVVHRDIKPENVILRGEEAVLIDFDASRLNKAEQTTDTQMMGTAGYAAPEQYGFAQTDARADIYALGVLLNEMLIRQHPAKQLAEGTYLPIISKCIEVNVGRRYSSARELYSALETVTAERKGGMKRSFVYRLIAVLAVGCLLVGGAFYGVSQWRAGQAQDPAASESFPVQTPKNEESVWDLRNEGYSTEFQYDLDGDGQKENYIFGVAFNNVLRGELITNERIGVPENGRPTRAPFPCVWKYAEDGTLTVVKEFSTLLEQPKTELRYISDMDVEQPIVQQLNSTWKGGLKIFYSSNSLGAWMYEVSAAIDGEKLTAAATTIVYTLDETQ